jgi:pilus assembly protein CpaC
MKSFSLRTALAHLAALALACTCLLAAKANAQAPMPWSPAGDGASGAVMAGAPAGRQAPMDLAHLARQPQQRRPDAPAGQTVAVDLSGPGGVARTLALPRGKSAVIELPVEASFASVTDPKVANIEVSSPRKYVVMGLSSGQTDAIFADSAGRQILRLNVRVDQDVTALDETLLRLLPGSSVRAEAVNESVILSGQVASVSEEVKAVRVAEAFVARPENVINMLSVAQPEQVMLKVRIVEVNRQIVKQLGVSLNALLSKIGETQIGVSSVANYGVNGNLEGGLTGNFNFVNKPGTKSVDAVLGAFEQVGLVRTLAEPNLTAVSGEAAKFLAGGKFPVPNGSALTSSVSYQSFGVGLGFTPIVLSKGLISLKISTEYSVLTSVGALTVAGSAGTTNTGGTASTSTSTTTTTSSNTSSSNSTTYPGISIRQAETTVELPSGGSMMIAGLLESVTQQDISALPGLMQLPTLGALFRSRDYQEQETELVVIVTPYLVKSMRPDEIQTPADGLQIADDLSTVLMGELNKGFNKPSTPPPGKTYQGPFGYVVE